MSYNRAILSGNVGGDPDIRHTQAGKKIASFSLATSESWKDRATGERKETTEWHRIVVFNEALAGIVEQYVQKGSKVLVEGQIKTREYEDREGIKRRATEIVISAFDGTIKLEGRPGGAQRSENDYGTTRDRPATTPSTSTQPNRGAPAPIDDDIPF